jgi:hypothetical protein
MAHAGTNVPRDRARTFGSTFSTVTVKNLVRDASASFRPSLVTVGTRPVGARSPGPTVAGPPGRTGARGYSWADTHLTVTKNIQYKKLTKA